MCVYSNISDYAHQRWPLDGISTGMVTITVEQWQEYLKLKRAAIEFDRKTGQPHCEDPEKLKWEEAVRRLFEKDPKDQL